MEPVPTDRLRSVPGAASVFEQTLKEAGHEPDDPDSIADAILDPDFQDLLKENLDKYWVDAAKAALTDTLKGKVLGNAARLGTKKILDKD